MKSIEANLSRLRAALCLITLLTLMPALSSRTAAATCFSAPTNIVGWWPGDGNANDIAGTNNGALQGGATASGAGTVGSAFTFDGTNGFVQIPNSASLRPTNLTIEAWVRFSGLDSAGSGGSPAGDQYMVFRQNTRSSDFEGFDLSKTRVGGSDVFRFLISSASGQTAEIHSSTTITTGLWYHVATVRGSNFTQIYVNGVLERGTNVTFAQDYGNFPLYFGTSGQPSWDHKLKGNLDEVSFYSRALSPSEISSIYAAGHAGKCKAPAITTQPQSQTALVGTNVTFIVVATGAASLNYQWRFNGGLLSGATDTSLSLSNVQYSAAGNYTVVVSNSLGSVTSAIAVLTITSPPCVAAPSGMVAWWPAENSTADSLGLDPGVVAGYGTFSYATGKVGQAFVFDGIHRDRVDLGNPANLQLQDFTIEAWVKRSSVADISFDDNNEDGAVAGEGGIIFGYGRNGYGFGMINDGRLLLSKIDVDGLICTNGVSDTNWHHVAVAKSDTTATFYMDGADISGPIPYSTSFTFDTSACIGSRGDARGGTFYGMVDEPAIYNRVLSAAEIQAIYQADAKGKCPLPPAILTQPTGQTGYVSGNVLFNLLASGSPTLSYQWRSNSVNIGGATNSTLFLTNIQMSYAANYSVRVTNVAGSITSSVAVLTVLSAPPCDPAPSGLVAWWPGEGSTADIAGGNSVTSASYFIGPGEVGQGFVFMGTNNYVAVGNPSSLQLSNFTIDAWVKRSSSSAVSFGSFGNGIIFGYGQGGYGLYLDANGVPALSKIGFSQTKPVVGITNTSFHHLAVTKSGATVVFYIDGIAYSSPPYNPGFAYSTSAAIGARADNLDNCFYGTIDEPSVYNRPLLAAEVQAIYNAGVSGKCPLPPRILTQPSDVTGSVGSAASFIAFAAGSPTLSSRWYFNGGPLGTATTNNPGAIVLNFSSVQQSNAGSYQLVVTNAYGSATSAVVQLKVTYPSTITAWGYNDYGQCNVPAGLSDAVAIAAGGHHSLALRRDGTVVAWGWNGNGQCNVPAGLSNVVAVGGGTYFSAALKSDGTVVSWGDLYNGSLAQMPPGLSRAVVLDSGGAENLVMKPDATLVAWGYGGDGRLNIPTSATNILAIAAGHAAHNLALLRDRTIVGWGDPGYGALNIPPGLSNVAQIDLGWGFSVVLKTDGSVSIWGSFTDYGPTYLPPGLPPLQTIAAGYEHILGIQSDGTVTAWGHNRIGQTTVPPGLANVVAVAGGLFHSLALSRQGPPEIFQQPSDEVVIRDGAVEFISAAVGDHLQYQWKFNGANVSGGSLARLLLTNVQPAQIGLYSVAISNASGFAVSSNASLSIIPLLITAHPTNQTIFEAADTSFGVAANGTAPIYYQWFLYGTNLIGQTNQSLILTNVNAAQAGPYSVIVSNAYGSAQSSNALLTVNLPAITSQPVSQSVIGGQQVTFTVGANGAALTYQWRFNSSPIPGQTDTSITLTNVSPDNAGSYSVAINNSHRTLLSSNADLTVTPLIITQQPVSASVLINSNVTFTAAAAGTTPLFYQWQKDGQPFTDTVRIVGSASNVLNISSLQTNDAGAYTLVISNAYTSLTSQVATLTVRYPPVIVQNPLSQTNLITSNTTFTVVADGRPPLAYAWTFNGAPVAEGTHFSGTATPTLTISNLVSGDSGNYAAVVTNSDGAITSAVAVLIVVQPPMFVIQPVGCLVVPGLPATFSASAAGTGPIIYQWELNGADIPGATNTTYTITAVTATNYGHYHLVASNAYGTATSLDAVLAQGQIAAWGRSTPFNQTVVPLGATNIVAISAGNNGSGESHSVALRADGTVVAWGAYTSGQTNVPASATNIVAVAAGGAFSLALRADGTVFGWGNNGSGQLNVPSTLSNVVAIAAGGSHSVVLRSDGKVFAWGNNSAGQINIPSTLNRVVAIAAGNAHTLALRSDGTLVACGRSTDDRQLSPGPGSVPSGLSGVLAVAGGTVQNAALRTNGIAVAWGSATAAYTNIPLAATNITAVSAGDGFSMVLRADGLVFAWGLNSYNVTNVPLAVSNAIALAAGSGHALALLGDGRPIIAREPVGGTSFVGRDFTFNAIATGVASLAYRWQSNGLDIADATNSTLTLSNLTLGHSASYQLIVSNALGTIASVPIPLTVLDNPNLAFLSPLPALQTNYQAARVILNASVIGNGPLQYQWKFNGTNLPAGTNEDLIFDPILLTNSGNYAVTVSNLANTLSSISSSQRVVLVKAWGFLSNEPPATLTNAVALAVGYAGEPNSFGAYLALRSDGKIASWGVSSYGVTNLPASVTNFTVTAIAAGFEDALALRSDGTVAAWGYYPYGVTNPPAAATNVVAIACGDYHDLAVRNDGTVVVWGNNSNGQTNVPVTATNVIAVAGGGFHSLALRANGTLVAWGLNSSGQTTVPASATNVIAISAGNAHSLALRSDGTVVQWGNSGASSFQVPAGLSNIVAIAAGYFHSTALRNDGAPITWGSYYSGTALIPADVANVIHIAARGDRDAGIFGTRAPGATIQPYDRTLFRGSNTTFIARFAGVQPVAYQWQSNGTNVPGATNDTLTLTNLQFAQSGAYQLIASNSYGIGLSRIAKLSVTIPLPEALDTTNVTWITAGAAPWFGEPDISHDGVDASRSGSIGNNQDSILQTTLSGPAQISFWWKVSSEASFDVLEFKLDGVSQAIISGEVDWQQRSYVLSSGSHTLQWHYSKDASGSAGQDTAWVDQFLYAPDPPVITVQPVGQTNTAGARVLFNVSATGVPPLAYQWRQNGSNNVGINSNVLLLYPTTRSNNGIYSVLVSNPGGGTVSSNAVLKVIVPQRFSSGALIANGSVLFFSGDSDGGLLTSNDLSAFTAQASSNLMDWVSLPNALSITNGLLLLQDPNQSSYPSRFYRIVEQ